MANLNLRNQSKQDDEFNTHKCGKMLDYSIIEHDKKLIEVIITGATVPMIIELIVFVIII